MPVEMVGGVRRCTMDSAFAGMTGWGQGLTVHGERASYGEGCDQAVPDLGRSPSPTARLESRNNRP